MATVAMVWRGYGEGCGHSQKGNPHSTLPRVARVARARGRACACVGPGARTRTRAYACTRARACPVSTLSTLGKEMKGNGNLAPRAR